MQQEQDQRDEQKTKQRWEAEQTRLRDAERQSQWDAQVGDYTRYPDSTVEGNRIDNGEFVGTLGTERDSGWTPVFTGGRGVALYRPTVLVGPGGVRQTSTPRALEERPQESGARDTSPGYHINHNGQAVDSEGMYAPEDTSRDAALARELADQEQAQAPLTDGEAQWQEEERLMREGHVKSAIYIPSVPPREEQLASESKQPEERRKLFQIDHGQSVATVSTNVPIDHGQSAENAALYAPPQYLGSGIPIDQGQNAENAALYAPLHHLGNGEERPDTPTAGQVDPRWEPSDGRQTGQTPFNTPTAQHVDSRWKPADGWPLGQTQYHLPKPVQQTGPGQLGQPVYHPSPRPPFIPHQGWDNGVNEMEGRRGPRPKFNLRTFGKDPNYTIEEFLSTMDDYVASFEDCAGEAVASVKSYLAGEASALVIDAGAREWSEIREVLQDHYIPPGHEKTHQTALVNMKLHKGETPTSLSIRVRTTMRKAFPTLARSHRDPMMINAFLQALGDDDVHKTVTFLSE